jgi:tRNA pseudouridine55 synthase
MINQNLNNRIILLDKPKGETSFDTISRLKRESGIKKIGHSGTLDKQASGLLVVATGKATRLTRFFLESDKIYEAEITLGVETDTHDSDGEVTARHELAGDEFDKIQTVLESFSGEISQLPPLYSALKVNGKRASDRVRNGETVELKERKITIYSIELIAQDRASSTFSIRVSCSKGTYIRSLARDIGNRLGCGAMITALRRTGSGIFHIENAVPGDQLSLLEEKKSAAVSMGKAVSFMNSITVSQFGRDKVMNGAQFTQDEIVKIDQKKGEFFAIFDEAENLVAISTVDFARWRVKYQAVFN